VIDGFFGGSSSYGIWPQFLVENIVWPCLELGLVASDVMVQQSRNLCGARMKLRDQA